MPEGPEIATFANDLNEILRGEKIRDYEYDSDFKHLKNIEQMNGNLRIKRVFAHGKKIVFEFYSGSYLLSFLGLEGRWYLADDDEILSSTLFKLIFKKFNLYYRDTRHFGFIKFIKDHDELISNLDEGLDILNAKTDKEEWDEVYEQAIRRHRQDIRLCEFLLDQRYILGIGNYLRAEIIYHAKIDPFKNIKDLSAEERERIRIASVEEMMKAYNARGASLRTYKDLHGNSGEYKTLIYGNKISPCGKEIEKGKDKTGRTIWYCNNSD